MKTALTQHAKNCLRRAGWTANRRIDVTDEISALTREGLFVNDAAVAFLKEFGDLNVRAAFHDDSRLGRFLNWINSRSTPVHAFNTCLLSGREPLLEHFGETYSEWVTLYRERVSDMCVVGMLSDDVTHMYIARGGEVYACWQWRLRLIGHDVADAINRLCDGGAFTNEAMDVVSGRLYRGL